MSRIAFVMASLFGVVTSARDASPGVSQVDAAGLSSAITKAVDAHGAVFARFYLTG